MTICLDSFQSQINIINYFSYIRLLATIVGTNEKRLRHFMTFCFIDNTVCHELVCIEVVLGSFGNSLSWVRLRTVFPGFDCIQFAKHKTSKKIAQRTLHALSQIISILCGKYCLILLGKGSLFYAVCGLILRGTSQHRTLPVEFVISLY